MKQCIAFISAFMLICTALTVSADNPQEKNDFETAAEILSRFHIITENDIKTGAENVKRKDMAFYTALFIAQMRVYQESFYGFKYEGYYNDMYTGEKKPIPFIDYDNKLYSDAIKYCRKENIMTDSWLACPEADVTLKDAVKMLVTALQYKGITDSEYIKKASAKEVRLLGEYAVFSFAGVSADKILTKNEAIMLLYNYMTSEYAADVERLTPCWSAKLERHEYIMKPYKYVMHTFGIYTAMPVSSKLTVNGREVSLDAYNIQGNTYMKIRDLAYIFKGTSKEFEIMYAPDAANALTDFVSIMIGVPYTSADNKKTEKKKADAATAFLEWGHPFAISYVLLADGKPDYFIYEGKKYPNTDFDLTKQGLFEVYKINGEYYYKLRELAEALDFYISHDGAKDTIAIDTSKSYSS